MQSNQCQLIEPREPLVILVEYDMCSLLQFPNTSGYDNEDDWNEDYRMSTRLGVNQSMLSLCGASVESVV